MQEFSQTPLERINAVYREVNDSLQDGKANHDAKCNGWQLRIAASDFGGVGIYATRYGKVIRFAENGETMTELLGRVDQATLDQLADCFEQAEWGNRLAKIR